MNVESDPDRRLAVLADRQLGVVTRHDLLACGLSRTAIADRVGRGRLRVLYRGVYSVGHRRLRREAEWLAAVWGSGRRAALSHWQAAALWDLLPSRGSRIHVTTPSRSGRIPNAERVVLHRVGTLRPWEITVTDGIPVTTTARTLLDLAPHLRSRALEDLIGRMDRLGHFDLVAVRGCLDDHRRTPGAPKLRRLLDDLHGVGAADLRSVLEARFLQLCDDHGLPVPLVNGRVAGLLVDFFWPDAALVVETDGYAFHATRSAFERDRERDQRLVIAGYRVVRVTYQQVMRAPAEVARRLRALIHGSGSLPTSM
ncbi:MAG TPA: type IV toxin-antitoxin system AbiEi family antitoxin domain-containing protein [Baekduia sp.]|uniref:type IV toxin-antitoxin system AbiEi family antitoxin domain-containing protein n=1 Tax=Baekduia sp. TaxID=2600305 RepID=UPI002D77401C|nr:type IV toxin-antitoxin system AbiEi family antitoxin domain-containing protein [Baekduia sp.]HET6508664.1 type IV toxin-antitoxin system AbiEi family antitoxin domain-containing protein [Baekduia sp.]